MKICFMGTPSFAAKPLEQIIKSNKYDVSYVYTKEPKPKGRKNIVQKTEVHELAEQYNIPVLHPKNFKNKEDINHFIEQKFDLCIVASYGIILPEKLINSVRLGCVNLHASILPRWRGASPIQMAIKHQDKKTGLTYMQMDKGMDTGDILKILEIDISKEDTFLTLFDKLTELAASSIIEAIDEIANGKLIPTKQNNNLVTYAPIIKKEDGLINFNVNATEIEHSIRAFQPFPACYFNYEGEKIKVFSAKSLEKTSNHEAGTVISTSPLVIECKDSALEIKTLQRPGKKILPANEFIKGLPIKLYYVI